MKKEKKTKPHVRFYSVLLLFLLETAFLITMLFLLIYYPFRDFLWIPIIVTVIVDGVTAFFIVSTKVNPGFKISWLAIVAMIPLGGAILYLLYSDKITTKKMRRLIYGVINSSLFKGRDDSTEVLEEIKKEDETAYMVGSLIYNSGFASIYKNTEIEYYKIGDECFEPMVEALKKAKKFIFVEYFIIDHGIFFDTIFEILKQKAKEGLDVRLIYDDFGSVFKVKAFFNKEAEKYGIKCIAFNRCRPIMDIRQNNRDHRKILVIDGVVGFSGGINIADEYINKIERFGVWKDNCFKLTGEAVTGLTNLFISNWNLAHKKQKLEIINYNYKTNENLLEKKPESDGYVQPFGDMPFDGKETARDAHLQLILRASKSIHLCTPYLVPDNELLQALCVASRSGVDVKIITPGIPDKKMAYQATRSFYAILMLNGVKIYEYTPGFNHEKMMVVDGKYCLTGTVNFDYRSFYLHFENDVFFYKSSKIKEMEDDFLEMISVSALVPRSKYTNVKNPFRRLYYGIVRIVAPLF